MAIKIKSLEVGQLTKRSLVKDFHYKDIEFDLTPSISYNNQLNKKESLKDVSGLFDIESIKNSITTAFLTAPGDKILSPEYGIDLREFLFESVDDFTADTIKTMIESKLPDFEPRVNIVDVNVVPDEDNNSYYIYLQIDVPSLDIYGLSIKSELNSIGYTTT